VICIDSGYDIHFAGAAGLEIKGTELLGHVATEEETIEAIGALTQLYREQGRYLERIYKWAKRVGLETIRQQIMEDGERRRALYDRFVFSQQFAQNDPWGERAQGKDAHEFKPVADLTLREAAE
jgi:nitrite reductase (NADH) large subunit